MASLVRLVSSGFSERTCLKKQGREPVKRTFDISRSGFPTSAYTYACTTAFTYLKMYMPVYNTQTFLFYIYLAFNLLYFWGHQFLFLHCDYLCISRPSSALFISNPSSYAWQPPLYSLLLWIWLFQVPRMHEIMHFDLHIVLMSLNVMFSMHIHIFAHDNFILWLNTIPLCKCTV